MQPLTIVAIILLSIVILIYPTILLIQHIRLIKNRNGGKWPKHSKDLDWRNK